MCLPRVLPILLSCTALSACADESSPAAPVELPRPTAEARGAPLNSGVVVRYQALALYSIPGSATGITAVVGTTTPFTEVCLPSEDTWVPVASTEVHTPAGRLALMDHGPELPVIVYGSYFNFGMTIEEICAIAASAPILATGTVRLRWMVKDPAAGSGAFMEQIRINGVVSLASGAPARISGALAIVVTPQGEERVFRERLSITPVAR